MFFHSFLIHTWVHSGAPSLSVSLLRFWEFLSSKTEQSNKQQRRKETIRIYILVYLSERKQAVWFLLFSINSIDFISINSFTVSWLGERSALSGLETKIETGTKTKIQIKFNQIMKYMVYKHINQWLVDLNWLNSLNWLIWFDFRCYIWGVSDPVLMSQFGLETLIKTPKRLKQS